MSKLNPQKAKSYVGPGVLRKGGKITPVPNGPLIKKKGSFKGSTLKTGGKIKKAQDGIRKGLTSPTQPVNSAGEVTTGMANPYKTSSGSTMSTGVRNSNSLTSKTQPVDRLGNVTTGMANPYKTNTSTPKPLSTGFRKGGTIKKAQTGAAMTKRDSLVANIKEQSRLRQNLTDFQKKVGSKPLTPELIREKDSLKGLLKDFSTKQRVKSTGLTEQQLAKNDSTYTEQERKKKSPVDDSGQLRCIGKDNQGCSGSQRASERRVRQEARRKNGGPVKKAQNGITKDDKGYTYTKQVTRPEGKRTYQGKSKDQATAMKIANFKIRNNPSDSLRTVKPVIKKNGGLIKRADGSFSKRGLWDNIRANKGSGKKPTKQMLVQEKKIKTKSKK
jgi:hypothetical protein